MIERTDAEILEFVNKLFIRPKDMPYDHPESDDYDYLSNFKVEIVRRDGRIDVTLGAMYESPRFNLKIGMAFADFFGTRNINDRDRFANGGCETCDYYSSYGYTLSISPEAK